ncbi:MAG: zinc-ribbon domain-containing protein [Bacteroidota bacterium]
MILFFGTRPGKPTTQPLDGALCPYCGQMGTLQFVSRANYFHVFWLPLFTIGTSRYVECSHCKRVYYEKEFTAEMKREIGL